MRLNRLSQDRPCMPGMWTFLHCSLMIYQVVMIVMWNLLLHNLC